MNFHFRAAGALVVAVLSLPAGAADGPSAPASAASAPASAASDPCLAPTPDRAANHACAAGLARHAEAESAAGHNDAARAALARADAFSPTDLSFAMTRAALALKLSNQLTPAGITAAAKTSPDDIGLALMHAELSIATKDYPASLADIDRVIAKRPDAPLAWEMRASSNVARPDFAAARADVDHALRLDPKSAGALRLRGVLRNNSGDHAGALADFEAAHVLAPRPDDPFAIGSTQFLQRHFGDAAQTLATKAPATPEGMYWRLWRYMALARLEGVEQASGSLGPGTQPGPGVPWPGPVIDYFHGSLDASALLDDARRAQAAQDLSQVCEAHFYMAEESLLRQRDDATALLRETIAECPQNFHEYEGAAAELRAAGLSLAAPGPTRAAAAAATPPASAASR